MTDELIPFRSSATSLATQGRIGLAGLNKRRGIYHLRMRVPARYASVEPRAELHRSLKTGDKSVALQRLPTVEAHVLAELDARLAGRDAPGSGSHYEAIARLTSARGFGYKTAQELAEGDMSEILRRLDDLRAAGDKPDSTEAQAILGLVDRPRKSLLSVAQKMDEVSPLDVRDKNGKQLRVWRDKWLRPAKKVRDLLGRDPDLDTLSRSDAIAFRDALKDRILEGDLKGSSAQTDLQNLNRMWKLYHIHIGYDSAEVPLCPFRGIGEGLAKIDKDGQKKEVPLEVIQELLAPCAMNHMNDELADITRILVETGCRQSEVTDLPPSAIFLDHSIPHIVIQRKTGDYAREIKNKHSTRAVPLVGVALEAMRRHPEGFSRYRGKGTYSAAANKSLADILPEGVTIGGLRHSFDKRCDDAGIKNEHVAQLMGHSRKASRGREVYGDNLDLERRLEYHRMIEIKPVRALPAPVQSDEPDQ